MHRAETTALRWGLLTVLAALVPVGCQNVDGWSADQNDGQDWSAQKPSSASAEQDLDEGSEVNGDRPPTPQTLYSLAKILAAQGKDSQCRAVLAKCIQDHPEFMPAYCDLAELHLRHNRVTDAMGALRSGLAVAPDDPVLRNNLGMCWLLKGRAKQALGHFTAAAGTCPDSVKYRTNMAVALGLLGRQDEASALFTQTMSDKDAKHNLQVVKTARARKALTSSHPDLPPAATADTFPASHDVADTTGR